MFCQLRPVTSHYLSCLRRGRVSPLPCCLTCLPTSCLLLLGFFLSTRLFSRSLLRQFFILWTVESQNQAVHKARMKHQAQPVRTTLTSAAHRHTASKRGCSIPRDPGGFQFPRLRSHNPVVKSSFTCFPGTTATARNVNRGTGTPGEAPRLTPPACTHRIQLCKGNDYTWGGGQVPSEGREPAHHHPVPPHLVPLPFVTQGVSVQFMLHISRVVQTPAN